MAPGCKCGTEDCPGPYATVAIKALFPGASGKDCFCKGVTTSSPCLPSCAKDTAAIVNQAVVSAKRIDFLSVMRFSSGRRHLAEADCKTVPTIDRSDG